MPKEKIHRTMLDELRNKPTKMYMEIHDKRVFYSELDLSGYEQFVISNEVLQQAVELIKDAWIAREHDNNASYASEIERNFRLPFDRMYIEINTPEGIPMGFLVDRNDGFVRSVGTQFYGASARVNKFQVNIKIDEDSGGIDTTHRDGLLVTPSELIGRPLTKTYGSEKAKETYDYEARSFQQDPYFEEILDTMFSSAMKVVIGCVTLMNARNGITRTVMPAIKPPAGAGKKTKREKSRSKFTVVSLSDVEQVDSEGKVTPRNLPSAHKVRGHFKRKKKGLYWWRPHVRGLGQLQEREAYVVKQ